MKSVIIAAVLLCLGLVGMGVYFATRDESSGPRLIALDPAYEARVKEGGYVKGAEKPRVTLLEYGDFQCPTCRAVYPMINSALAAFPDTLQVEYRHYPIPSHNKTIVAIYASEAAGRQGKFWQMHEQLFANQESWRDQTIPEFRKTVETYASQIQLNLEQFKRDMKDTSIDSLIDASKAEADKIPLEGTPTILINGKLINIQEPPLTEEVLKQYITDAAAAVQ